MFGDVFGLYKYLRKNNVNAYFTLYLKINVLEILKMLIWNILYIHNRGSHYVVKNLGNGKCIYYNAVYGEIIML